MRRVPVGRPRARFGGMLPGRHALSFRSLFPYVLRPKPSRAKRGLSGLSRHTYNESHASPYPSGRSFFRGK